MYLSKKTQEDYNKSPTLQEDFFTNSNSFEDEIDEAPTESDFLDPFDDTYNTLDLWRSFRLLQKVNRPDELPEEEIDAREDSDSYIDDEEKEQSLYNLIELDEEDSDNFINIPYFKLVEEDDLENNLDYFEQPEETFEIEEEPENLERRIAA